MAFILRVFPIAVNEQAKRPPYCNLGVTFIPFDTSFSAGVLENPIRATLLVHYLLDRCLNGVPFLQYLYEQLQWYLMTKLQIYSVSPLKSANCHTDIVCATCHSANKVLGILSYRVRTTVLHAQFKHNRISQ